MSAGKDVYSSFGFYTALDADVYSAAAAGETIDLQSFEAATIAITTNSFASDGACLAANVWKLILEHGLDDGAGAASAWSLVPGSQLIHSVYGGYDSTGEDGIWKYINSGTDASGVTHFVGYKKDVLHRHLRFYLSASGAPSAMWAAGIAFCGYPNNWPVNEPI